MAKTLSLKQTDVRTYPALFRRVKETLLEGRRRIEAEKVRTRWDAGRLIQTHILANQERAEYGAEVVPRLARDLGVSSDLLYRCRKFFLAYPDLKILATRPEFSWSHYKTLISVSDDRTRSTLDALAQKGGWSSRELAARIKADAAGKSSAGNGQPPDPLDPRPASRGSRLTPLRGKLYTYRVLKPRMLASSDESPLLLDLGFEVTRDVEPRLLSQFADGDIVASVPKDDAYRFAKAERTAQDLYTYNAYVERVVDGDTLKVRLDLGFGVRVRQTLRLRGIDCPELKTKAGDAAKAFVQSILKESDR
ncbi:MAG: hypothetical protein HGA80_07335, partial [Candidatus Omnitrophica bacterium]|nr:hypothetical protein [Candidatus Omnitrophota bacterium]